MGPGEEEVDREERCLVVHLPTANVPSAFVQEDRAAETVDRVGWLSICLLSVAR